MKKKTKIGLALAGLTGMAGIVYDMAVRTFVSVAFDKEPKVNMMGNGPKAELKGIAAEGQRWLLEHDHDVRTMTNREGMHLRCHYFPCQNAKRTVIEFHGWHSHWHRDFSASSPYLHAMGCNLLIVEQRGQGESDGREMTFGLKERFDVLDVVDWYQSEIDSQIPIYLAGVSMGASTVLMASSEHFPVEVKGILADCGFSSAYEIIRLVGFQRFHIPEHPFMDSINFYCRRRYGIDLKAWTTIDAVKKSTLPILFVHGEADSFVPCEMSIEAYEACTSWKDILLVDGAQHGMSFVVDKEAYIEKVKGLFAFD